MRLFIFLLLIPFALSCTENPKDRPLQVRADAIENLANLASKDNFSEEQGTLFYTGVHDPLLRAHLNRQFNSVVRSFIAAVGNGATREQFLELLRTGIYAFNRSELDTEDAERVAGNFEKIMDCIGLKSSGGILNKWMYDFDPKPHG